MTPDEDARARAWYSAHKRDVNMMLSVDGPMAEPTGIDPKQFFIKPPPKDETEEQVCIHGCGGVAAT